MNIFYLDDNVVKCAEYHNDKHVVKMILEYAQLLSTAHRVIDGYEYTDASSGRKIKRWKLYNEKEQHLYKATHVNHPSAVWARQFDNNYRYLYGLFDCLLKEYTYRYGKQHACEKMRPYLIDTPRKIPTGYFTQPTPAMPDEYKVANDSIQSYRNYYVGAKKSMANWKKRPVPEWFENSA